MRDAIDQVLSCAIDWDAVARAVRTLSSADDEPFGVAPAPPLAGGKKKSTTLTTNVSNRLSDFDTFDWD